VRENKAQSNGLTLVEMLMILVTVSVMMTISLPRVLALQNGSKSELRGSLNSCRAAVNAFHGDTGFYPTSIADLAAVSPPRAGLDARGAAHPINPTHWQGPYLSQIPINPNNATLFSYGSRAPHVGQVNSTY